MKDSLHSRPKVEGIAIDSANTRLVDDAFNIRKTQEGWIIDVSVADVGAFVPAGSEMDRRAQSIDSQNRKTNHRGEKSMLPRDFSINNLSLAQGEWRLAVTFSIHLDKNLDIETYRIQQTACMTTERFVQSDVRRHIRNGNKFLEEGLDLALRLQRKRSLDMRDICAGALEHPYEESMLVGGPSRHRHTGNDGELLVHEMMRLANLVAANYLCSKGLIKDKTRQRFSVDPVCVSRDFNFDMACNKHIYDMIRAMDKKMPAYAHITSPIRRYEDMTLLRQITSNLSGDCLIEYSAHTDDLRDHFSKAANPQSFHLMRPEWEKEWRRFAAENAWQDRHGERTDVADAGLDSLLNRACVKRGWFAPKIASREICAANSVAYIAFMKLEPKDEGEDPLFFAASGLSENKTALAVYKAALNVFEQKYPHMECLAAARGQSDLGNFTQNLAL